MKKKILVLQFRTDQSLKHEQQCFTSVAKLSRNTIDFLNVFAETPLNSLKNKLKNYAFVIVSGSGQFDLTNLPKKQATRIKKVKPFIKHLIETDFPTLGICFGHQLICNVMGAKIKKDKNQAESGTVKVYLTKGGRKSQLFKNFPNSFYAIEGHKDSVSTKPKKGVLLANTRRNKYHSFRFGKNVFTTQFHPELNKDAVGYRFTLYPEYLATNSLEKIMSEFKETKQTAQVFRNLLSLTNE